MTQAYQAWQAAEVKSTQADDQAQGQVNADKVQWENAKASLAALESGRRRQQRRSRWRRARSQIDEVNVSNAQAAVAAATLKAPTGGTVEEVNITDGQQISTWRHGRRFVRLERDRDPRHRHHHAGRLRGHRFGERRARQRDRGRTDRAGRRRRVERRGRRQGDRGRRGGDGHVGRCDLPGDRGPERRESLVAAGDVRVGERDHQPGRRCHHRAHQCGAHDRRRQHGHAVRQRQAGSDRA